MSSSIIFQLKLYIRIFQYSLVLTYIRTLRKLSLKCKSVIQAGEWYRLIIFIITISITTISRAEVITTYSVNSSTVKKIEEWVDKDTIIFIEIDDVLVMPKSKMFSYDSNPYRMFLNNLVTLGDRSPVYNKAIANWYGQRKVRLVEDGWIDFIQRVRDKGAKVYGLCSMPIELLNINEKRLKELQDLGIVFDSKINGKEQLIINNERSWPSMFDKGIVYTNAFAKSEAILDLFKVTNLSPKKLLSFGHIKYKVKAFDKVLRRFNMYFKSVLYLGSREVTGRPDAEIVRFQQRELIEKGKWYEDEEAGKLVDFRRQESANRSTESK